MIDLLSKASFLEDLFATYKIPANCAPDGSTHDILNKIYYGTLTIDIYFTPIKEKIRGTKTIDG
jgi:hypothetical protein